MIVSNFDATFRVVASGLAVGIMPIPIRPASWPRPAWARRRFIVCFRKWADLQPAAQRMVDYLEGRADLADR